MPKGRNLVDDEMDSRDYADEYADEQYWQDEKEVVKEEDKETPALAPKQAAAKPAPPKPSGPKPAKPKAVAPAISAKPPRTPTPPLEEEKEPILEMVDDWEAAMDALDAHISAQEEKKVAVAAAAKQKGGPK